MKAMVLGCCWNPRVQHAPIKQTFSLPREVVGAVKKDLGYIPGIVLGFLQNLLLLSSFGVVAVGAESLTTKWVGMLIVKTPGLNGFRSIFLLPASLEVHT